MLIATTNELPGYEIDEVYGEVFGLTVRSRNAFSQMGAGLKSMFGGELKGMTKALADSRAEVDDIVARAVSGGGRGDPSPIDDYGWMYGRSFEDPDGHMWGVNWMDMAAATAAQAATADA